MSTTAIGSPRSTTLRMPTTRAFVGTFLRTYVFSLDQR